MRMFVWTFLDAKGDGDDGNVGDKDDKENQKVDGKKGKKNGEKKKENGEKEKEDGEKGAQKISVASKKRKSGVEKSLELVFDKFKQANNDDFER